MVYMPPATVIGNNVFLGPRVNLTNDPYPQSDKLNGATIKDNTTICATVVIRPSITIGRDSVVGMGAIVTRDVEPGSVVYGSPATNRYEILEYKSRQEKWVNQIR